MKALLCEINTLFVVSRLIFIVVRSDLRDAGTDSNHYPD